MDTTIQNQNPVEAPLDQPDQKIINNQRGNFILIIGVVVLVLVIGIVAYILGTKANKSPNTALQTTNIPTPTQPLENENAKDITTISQKILYEDNGFSFYYPNSLEMYQTYVGDATQWKPKTADRIYNKEGLDALTLHESDNPLAAITTNGKYTIWNKGYFDARTDVTVNSVKEDSVSLGQNKTTLFTIECGNKCHYSVVRFTSNGKYYEFIYNLNSGDINQLKEIIASINFFNPNAKEWRSFTSKEGHYSIQYPSNSNFLEKVGWSVDGVRGYSDNVITIFPQKFGITFENVGKMTLDEYLKKNECGTISERKRFTLSGEQAEYQSTACGIEGTSDVYVKHKDMIYVINYTTPEDPILATFKFTD